jgi:uncharacterized damage-inducible protein DinB
MPFKSGLLEEDGLENQPIPKTIDEIINIYKEQSELICKAVKKKWTDDDLDEEIEMYGFKWSKGKVLSILVRHQTHHRAQMTILLRQIGVKVPGIYGPAQEEWVEYGMPAME